MQITDAELCVMKALWAKEPCTSSDIVEAVSKNQDWNDKTIRSLLNRLVAKKAVKAEKNGSKAFTYTSLISESNYKAHENVTFVNKLYGGSVKMMLASFVESGDISQDDIKNLIDILEGK